MSSTNTVVAVGVTPEKLANVRKWNIGLTALHLGQAAAVLLLTNDFAIKILDSTPAALQVPKVLLLQLSLKYASVGLWLHF